MIANNQLKVEKISLFKEYYLKLKSSLDENHLVRFGKLKTDEERIKFISEIVPLDNGPSVEEIGNGKNDEMGKELKELGNQAFRKNHFNQALKFYTDSILLTSQDEEKTDLALTIANRSAVFYHLQEYQLAIDDIDFALSLNYPQDLKYKVLERKGKCFLALKKHEKALTEFKNAIKALDCSKLSAEKKAQSQTNIQIMLEFLTKEMTSKKLTQTEAKEKEEMVTTLTGSRNKIYEEASEKVDIKEEASVGRFASAAQNIDPGETILVEKAYCSVLLGEFSKTNCEHCFKKTIAPYPCKNCTSTIFCSSKCKTSAESTYHKYECSVMEVLRRSGVSVTVLMALRIITQNDLEHFMKLKDELSEPRRCLKKYQSSDYVNVYHLVRHENLRGNEDLFERAVMALFLVRCLKKGCYFPQSDQENGTLSQEEAFVGGLVLRHLQILQFNAHEISELEFPSSCNLEESKSVFIGGGLYPTLALFNHSCDPGIVRYFEGTKVVVKAVKPIRKGEMIAENYGPIYSQMQKKERREKLKSQYWFDCTCVPCVESWPIFEEIDRKILRFRCDPGKAEGKKGADCQNVLLVPVDTPEFMIKCSVCGRFTNLFKGLKTLKETDEMYTQAAEKSRKGDYRGALTIYLEILGLLHDVLAPPFRDYLLCQQSIRKCMLTMGNLYGNPNIVANKYLDQRLKDLDFQPKCLQHDFSKK